MDSGNSGSMQSSSTAGDEDSYDSRADNSSISAFLLNNNNPTPPPLSFTAQQHHMFDPLSNYLDPTQRSPSNLDMMWSKISRSEPNQSDLAAFVSSSQQNQPFLLSQLGGGSQGGVGVSGSAFHTAHHSLPQETVSSRGGSLSVSAANDNNSNSNNNNNNNNNNMVRNPKKRSRASRRAPTTVLTTDTNNFRAMVQEFTGIPAPPFTSFPRTRLDLFGSSSSSSPTIRSTSSHLDPPIRTPPYLLRPFAHKPQPSPIPSPSSLPSMVDTSTSNNSSNSNYHLNMHNPILSFLHPPLNPKYSPALVASKTQQQQQPSLEIPPNSVVDSHLKMGGGVLEELGLNHPHVGNMVQSSSDGALMARVNNNNNNMRNPSVDWAQRIGNNSNDGGGVLRSLSGTINYRSNATPSDFHGEKGPDCAVAARSQGMVESWINCSSDT